MKRRQVLKAVGLATAGTAIAMPAIAPSAPEIRWRLTSSFPKTPDTTFDGTEVSAKAVLRASDGKFKIQVFAAHEIAPDLQALDRSTVGRTKIACLSKPRKDRRNCRAVLSSTVS